jgi:hypothetical protein
MATLSVTFIKGLRMGGVVGKIPKPILKILFREMAKGTDWEENLSGNQSISFGGFDHNAPDEKEPEKTAQVLKDFLNRK